jgi:Spy/CpxP family protein refolding chaperone
MNETSFPRHRRGGARVLITTAVVTIGVVWLAGLLGSRGPHRQHAAGRSTPRDHVLADGGEHLLRGASVVLDELGATPAQRTAIEAALEEQRARFGEWRRDRDALKAELRELLQAERFDPDAAAEVKAATLALAAESLGGTIDALFAAAEVLTPAQRRELLEHWRERHR